MVESRLGGWRPGMRHVIGAVIAVVVMLGLVVGFGTYAVVDPGQRGVYVLFGNAREESLAPGLHWKNPFADVVKVNARQVVYDQDCEASSSDLQTIHASVAVNYRPDPAEVWRLYKDVGATNREWQDVLLRPAVDEITKAVTARFTAEALIHRRDEAKAAITELIIQRLSREHIIVTEVSITDFGFNKGFNDAIEAKEIAEQRAQQANNDLERAEIDAQQEVVKAEAAKKARVLHAQAEAESIRIVAEAEAEYQERIAATATDAGLRLRMLERWNGVMPQVVGEDGGVLLELGPTRSGARGSGVTTPKAKSATGSTKPAAGAATKRGHASAG